MKTSKGVKLNAHEIKLINDLKRVAKKWDIYGKDLWLFSASGTLHVMMWGDTIRNPEPDHVFGGSVNQNNIITTILIPNDGGDW